MKKITIRAVGVPWYSRERYARILEVMEDSSVLPDTYEQWRQGAEASVLELRTNGVTVIQADIEPRKFVSWCRHRRHHANAAARQAFATGVALVSICRYAGNG